MGKECRHYIDRTLIGRTNEKKQHQEIHASLQVLSKFAIHSQFNYTINKVHWGLSLSEIGVRESNLILVCSRLHHNNWRLLYQGKVKIQTPVRKNLKFKH